MADDVRHPYTLTLDRANLASCSPEPYLRLHSQMRTLHQAMMEVSQTVEVPTKTTKASTKTSKQNPNLKLVRNLTLITKAVAVIVMRRWKMRIAMLLRKQCQNAQRKNRRQPNDNLVSHQRTWAGACFRVQGGEGAAVHPMFLNFLYAMHGCRAFLPRTR